MRRPLALAILTGLAAQSACSTPPGGFDSPVPSARLDAAVEAARTQDQSAIPRLIELLDSDDPAVRMTAIATLEDLTGQTQGYRFWDPPWKREEGVQAWVRWYSQRSGGSINREGGAEPPPVEGGSEAARPSDQGA